MKRPPAGLTIPVRLAKVQDGDTVYVTREGSNVVYHVRLLNCWAPELNTEAGKRSKEYAEQVLNRVKQLYLTIYFETLTGDFIDVLGKLTSMGRLLGDLWVDEETTLSQVMTGGFHATKTKQQAK